MKPIRGEKKAVTATNPWTGRQQFISETKSAHEINDLGALESSSVEELSVSSCGHVAPPAGFCAHCVDQGLEGTVCASCLGECASCLKPICHRHSFSHQESVYCEPCRDALRRKHLTKRIGRFLFSPFVRFEDGNG